MSLSSNITSVRPTCAMEIRCLSVISPPRRRTRVAAGLDSVGDKRGLSDLRTLTMPPSQRLDGARPVDLLLTGSEHGEARVVAA